MTNRELLEAIVIKLDHIDQRLDKVEQRLDTLVSNLESGQISMERRITNIELTLENEVCRNICTIAEAHLDLSRKFDQALKVKEDDELIRVRLNVLENDVRKIKQRLEIA